MKEEEKSANQPVGPEESREVDNVYQDYREEAKSFDVTHLSQRRCAACSTPLTSPYDFHGFNVLYCEKDKKPVCRICRYPTLELIGTNAIHCTHQKCPTYQVITDKKGKGDGKGNEPTEETKKSQEGRRP
jgi:hypothetical protein